MFRFLHGWWPRPLPQKPHHVQPSLESLETRDLCAAMLLSSGARLESDEGGYSISAASDVPVPEQDATRPIISDFEAIEEAPGIWTFRGQVTGDDMAGMTVTLGGLPSLNGQVVQVEEDGWFYCTVQLQAGEHGMATAQATDWLGNVSNVAVTRVPRW
jgi:hypothetical protein